MPFVLDASVALAWCFEDERSQIADRASERVANGDHPFVPIIWIYETTNSVLTAERRQRLTADRREVALDLLRRLPYVLDAPEVSCISTSLFETARQYNLSVYDASYLDLAIREGLPLATLDRALERAAREAGVELLA